MLGTREAKRFLRATWAILKEAREDNLTGEAAKVAYYAFLSLWPLFLGLFALTGLLGGEPAFEWIMNGIKSIMPPEPTRFLERFVREITGQQRPDILSLGIVLTFWSGSNIFASLTDGLNTIYDVEEGRSWWKRRLLALGLLVCASVLASGGATAVLAGAEILAALGLADAWNLARWPLAYLFLTALAWVAYYYLPDREQDLSVRYVTIGALVGTGLWLLATTGFRVYVANWGSYGSTYGLVGGILVLLIWLYLTALSILFGGEVAVSLEQGLHRKDE
ncbi:MAG TPA: YihY/virulence factor BrkB family protein [Longimicrobiaceae bacterium]|nr:YihY/virulence factor BrkB family protein [Longimicrobiaceae bacterium]